jgi:hypothetical protein
LAGEQIMSDAGGNKKEDLSSSLFWTILAPIHEIDDRNADAVVDWLKDRSSVLVWFTSIITGSIVLLTLFGNKPGFDRPGSIVLSISRVLMLFSIPGRSNGTEF